MHPLIVRCGSFQDHYVYRVVHILATAGGFTRMRANPAANSRKRHVFTDSVQGVPELVVLDFFNVFRDIDMCRAPVHAGRGILVNVAVGFRDAGTVQAGDEGVAVMLHSV